MKRPDEEMAAIAYYSHVTVCHEVGMKMTPALDDQGGGIATVESRWLWLHAGLPLAALAISSAILWGAGGDHWIADHLYQLEGRHWQWKMTG